MAALRRLALLLLFLLPMAPAHTFAADPVSLPGFEAFNAGVTIDFLAAGTIDSDPDATPHIVVERIELETDGTVPFADAIQSIAVLDGRLVMIDDLGLNTSLKAGKQTFAPAGSFSRIRASEPTTLLRARIAPPPVDITIYEDRCDPTALTRTSGSTLVVRNATGASQPFTIPSLDIDVDIPAGQLASVPLQAVEETNWTISCGNDPRNDAPIDVVTLTISNDAPAPKTTETEGTTVLFDGLLPLTEDGDATFFLAQLAIGPSGSLGEQTFSGPTTVIAGDQPLQIERPGKPKATLKAGGQVLFPAGAVATISNPGGSVTTALVAGVAPIAEATPEPTPPAPTAEPTQPPTAPEAPAEPVDLATFLPSDDALSAIGFFTVETGNLNSFDESALTIMSSTRFADDWKTGMYAVCLPQSESQGVLQAQLEFDQFGTPSNAALMFGVFKRSASSFGEPVDPPATVSADGVVGWFQTDLTTNGLDGVVMMGYYDAVIVTVVVLVPDGSDTAEAGAAARDIFLAIDATR